MTNAFEEDVDEYLLTCDKSGRACVLSSFADDLERWTRSIRRDKPPCSQCGGRRYVHVVVEREGYMEGSTPLCGLCVTSANVAEVKKELGR